MSDSSEFIIKARGLPWSSTVKDVYEFFKDCNIVGEENGIHMTFDKQGRPSGECFVEFASELDVEKAKAHDGENMGKRYIEIHDAKRTELEWCLNHSPGSAGDGGKNIDGFVRLRGLPFEATKKDIADFFAGIEIAPYGITVTMDQDGRASGEAYVEFISPAEAEKALQKNKEKIGHRYIEIFNSSKEDVKYVTRSNTFGGGFPQQMGGRPGPYDRPVGFPGRGRGGMGPSGFNTAGRNPRGTGRPARGGKSTDAAKGDKDSTSKTGHMVHMRGLPFEATQGDVYQFLAPFIPTEVRMLYEESGRPKGECDADFNTHSDAEAAMSKNKQNMGRRYIELFLKSEPDYDSYSGGMMGGGNNFGNMGGGYGGNFGYSAFGGNTNYSSMPQSSGW